MMIWLSFYLLIFLEHLLKLNIKSTLTLITLNFLLLMTQFIKPRVVIPYNKIVLLNEIIGTL